MIKMLGNAHKPELHDKFLAEAVKLLMEKAKKMKKPEYIAPPHAHDEGEAHKHEAPEAEHEHKEGEPEHKHEEPGHTDEHEEPGHKNEHAEPEHKHKEPESTEKHGH